MATPLVLPTITAAWVDVAGAAASVAGVTWQNVGLQTVLLSFTGTAPGVSDAYVVLRPFDAFYDANGSANAFARVLGGAGTSQLSATGD